MKKIFNKKLSLKKQTVANVTHEQMGKAVAGKEAQPTGPRSKCICADTDLCPTSYYIICQYTCGDTCTTVSDCGTVCNSNPCC